MRTHFIHPSVRIINIAHADIITSSQEPPTGTVTFDTRIDNQPPVDIFL